MRPAVSVLIPARDAATTIGPALRSLRAQTLADWEAVIVDDGSQDGTAEIVQRMVDNDPRFRLTRIPASGIVSALNAGLELCRAPLVARFDADDLMHKHRLAMQCALLAEHPEIAGAGSLVRCFPRRALRDGMRHYEQWQNALVDGAAIMRERFVESPLVHPSVTVRAEVLKSAGGWREISWPEDWDLWLRLLEQGHVFEKVPKVLHFWRDDPSRLTRRDPRYSTAALTEARADFLTRGPLRDRPAVIWGAGPVGKSLMRSLDKVGAKVEALIDVDPRKIGQQVHGRRVLAPDAIQRVRPAVLLAGVGARGAREDIRRAALAAGFIEGRDFFACA